LICRKKIYFFDVLNNKVVLHFGAKASVAKTAFHTHPVTTSIFIPEFPKKTQKNRVPSPGHPQSIRRFSRSFVSSLRR